MIIAANNVAMKTHAFITRVKLVRSFQVVNLKFVTYILSVIYESIFEICE